jgi:hypothetical protein
MAPALGGVPMAAAQGVDAVPRVEQQRANPVRPRVRSATRRDRAFRVDGSSSSPGFSGFGHRQPVPVAPQTVLAPRPDVDQEYRPTLRDPPHVATLSPTLINPSIPGRGAAADGALNQREQRLLGNPAAGARFSVPMTW